MSKFLEYKTTHGTDRESVKVMGEEDLCSIWDVNSVASQFLFHLLLFSQKARILYFYNVLRGFLILWKYLNYSFLFNMQRTSKFCFYLL